MPLFYRYGADDMREGGLTLQEAKLAAQKLEKVGHGCFRCVRGYRRRRTKDSHRTGVFVPLAAGIKEAVKVPVIGVGHITEPEYADSIIREGKVDMVAIGVCIIGPGIPQTGGGETGCETRALKGPVLFLKSNFHPSIQLSPTRWERTNGAASRRASVIR